MTDYLDIMVDLETLDTKPSAVVVSMGACVFNRKFSGVHVEDALRGRETFERDFELGLQLADGRTISEDTLRWWMTGVDQETRDYNFGTKAFPVPWTIVNRDFANWLSNQKSKSAVGATVCLWSHGAPFDLPILDSLFDLSSFTNFSNYRDTRTLYELTGIEREKEVDGLKKHTPLADCIIQARACERAFAKLNANMVYDGAK